MGKNPHKNRCRISLQAQISGAHEPEHLKKYKENKKVYEEYQRINYNTDKKELFDKLYERKEDIENELGFVCNTSRTLVVKRKHCANMTLFTA